MGIKFTKMHGLGNDFMVIDGINQQIQLTAEDIRFLSQRDIGIGFDQCLLVEASDDSNIDFKYRIFNANGQEVGQCGNGARCLARFLAYYQLTDKKDMLVATSTTQMRLRINSDQSVSVDMGRPKLNPDEIPTTASQHNKGFMVSLEDHQDLFLHAINVGNPHAVLEVTDIDHAPVQALGCQLSTHDAFPEQANIGFMEIMSPDYIKLRVYERGCGETRACGSGAVAAAAIGRLHYGMNEKIKVQLPGGQLVVHWPKLDGEIYLTGPANFVYEGQLMDMD